MPWLRVGLLIALLSIPLLPYSAQHLLKGEASFYARKFHGRTTASGEKYDRNKLTAAHKTLPFGTRVKVTNLRNKKSVEVVVNDRGSYAKGRIIDLSEAAAKRIDMIEDGVVPVQVEILPAQKKEAKTQSSWAATGDGTYKIAVSTAQVKGYGVQVASYQEFYNVLERLEALKAKGYGDTYVNAATVNGMRTFRILVGRFDTEKYAKTYAAKLEKRFGGKGYFVVQYP